MTVGDWVDTFFFDDEFTSCVFLPFDDMHSKKKLSNSVTTYKVTRYLERNSVG